MLGIADNRDPNSCASGFRRRRLDCFCHVFRPDEKTRILDLGGSVPFWEKAGIQADITILNLSAPPRALPDRFHYVQGDARDLSRYPDGQFDVVFSNSVIEHVGDRRDQEKMAREVRRVGQGYFVQVPNRNFPMEPHFLFPAFQFLPVRLRCFVAKRWPYGWPRPGSAEALHSAEQLRLLTCPELSRLFPDAVILGEFFWFFNKSLIAVRAPNRLSDFAGFRVIGGWGRGPGMSIC